jgi:hypothetical protein
VRISTQQGRVGIRLSNPQSIASLRPPHRSSANATTVSPFAESRRAAPPQAHAEPASRRPHLTLARAHKAQLAMSQRRAPRPCAPADRRPGRSSASRRTHRSARRPDRAPDKPPRWRTPQTAPAPVPSRPAARLQSPGKSAHARQSTPRPALNLCRQIRLSPRSASMPRRSRSASRLIDGKGPIAALRAAQPAHQPLPRPPRRISQRRIHNLHQFRIASRQSHAAKHTGSPALIPPLP